VPRLGGLAVFLGWLTAVAAACLLPDQEELWRVLLPVATLAACAAGLGIWDDWKDLPGKGKLLGQVAIAALAFWVGWRVDRLTNPFGTPFLFPAPLSFLLTVFWIVGMMNAINLVDGLDGLAPGIVAIACTGLVAAGLYMHSYVAVPILAALAGACLGFLRYNFYPAQLFLGDGGSQLLGFLLAIAVLVDAQFKAAAAVALLLPLTALALPILDTGLAFIRRLRLRRSIFQADKYHLHHRLLKMGLSQRQAVLFIYMVCGYLSLMSFVFVLINTRYAFVLLLLLFLGAFVGLQALRFAELRFLSFHRRYQRSVRAFPRKAA